MKDSVSQLSPVSVVLHWVVGLAMIGMLSLGIFMEETEAFSLYPLHKSIGVIVLVIALIRVFWRLSNRWPSVLSNDGALLHFTARLVHWVLILATLLMPISGMVMSGMGGHGIAVFGVELVAANPDPANPMEMIPHNKALAGFAHEAHEVIGNLLILALLLHVVGALKHHVVNKDGTLRRMLGKRV